MVSAEGRRAGMRREGYRGCGDRGEGWMCGWDGMDGTEEFVVREDGAFARMGMDARLGF